MPFTDPLIKSLKYIIEEFCSIEEPVTDASPHLAPFCQNIEHALTQGIKLGAWDFLKQDGQSMRRKQFWNLLEHFQRRGPIPLSLSDAMTTAQQNNRLKHADGKVRHLIRQCLVRKTIHFVVEFFIRNQSDIAGHWYYANEERHNGETSIVINEPLVEQLRSLLMTAASSLTFVLDQRNAFFLDHTWNMPDMRTVEFAPTKELGLGIIHIDGHGIINRVKEGSIASDEHDISVGDLLVEMNGVSIYPIQPNGLNEITDLWKKCKRKEKPCRITVIKQRCPATGGVFNPLRQVLTQYQDIMEAYYNRRQRKIEQAFKEAEEQRAAMLSPLSVDSGKMPIADTTSGCGCYSVFYSGEVLVGNQGGMGQIEGVIKQAMQEKSPLLRLKVVLEITEIAVITRRIHHENSELSTNQAVARLLSDCSDAEGLRKDPVDLKEIEFKKHVVESHKEEALGDDEMSPSRRNSTDCLFNHKFADISSCGKLVTNDTHFCYIAGDTFCTISNQFKGYVFEARSLSQARLILNNIYQGFKRTTFFM